jgi:hypothetical protein
MQLSEALTHAQQQADKTRELATVHAVDNGLSPATCFNVYPGGAEVVHCGNVRGVSLGMDAKTLVRLLDNLHGWATGPVPF